ncbi:hypothetical protein PYCC9005_005666 [Savitreella phatthalungensis]
MDARALLSRQGWAGDGHPLRKGGLQHQLLAAHKRDAKGLGHAAHARRGGASAGISTPGEGEGDDWWSNVFASKLASIGVPGGPAPKAVAAPEREVPSNRKLLTRSLDKVFCWGGTMKTEDAPVKATVEASLGLLADDELEKQARALRKEERRQRREKRKEKRERKEQRAKHREDKRRRREERTLSKG